MGVHFMHLNKYKPHCQHKETRGFRKMHYAMCSNIRVYDQPMAHVQWQYLCVTTVAVVCYKFH
jgi:hypothetical protein